MLTAAQSHFRRSPRVALAPDQGRALQRKYAVVGPRPGDGEGRSAEASTTDIGLAESSISRSHRSHNRLLAALPTSELERILRYTTRVPTRRRQVLQESHVYSPYAYFIETGAASVMAGTRADGPVGAGMLGWFDVVGLPIVLGTLRSPLRALVQIPGEALRIGAEDLRRCLDQSEALRTILLRYVQAQLVQSAQLTVCSTRHDSNKRLARWLLLARDRLDDDDLCVTHELVGKVLGLRRASITEAVGRLEEAGIVRLRRGCITIVDRERLEQVSCECYRTIRAEYEYLAPTKSDSTPQPFGREIQPASQVPGPKRVMLCD